jgi:hypothetical protein
LVANRWQFDPLVVSGVPDVLVFTDLELLLGSVRKMQAHAIRTRRGHFLEAICLR